MGQVSSLGMEFQPPQAEVRRSGAGSEVLDSASHQLRLDKSNILMLGPTGSGEIAFHECGIIKCNVAQFLFLFLRQDPAGSDHCPVFGRSLRHLWLHYPHASRLCGRRHRVSHSQTPSGCELFSGKSSDRHRVPRWGRQNRSSAWDSPTEGCWWWGRAARDAQGEALDNLYHLGFRKCVARKSQMLMLLLKNRLLPAGNSGTNVFFSVLSNFFFHWRINNYCGCNRFFSQS